MLYLKKKIKKIVVYCLIVSLVCGNCMFHTFADSDKKTRRTIVFEYWATIKDYVKEPSTNVQDQYRDTYPITKLSEVDINGKLHIGAKNDGTYDSHEEKIYSDEIAEFLYSDNEITFSSVNKNFSKTYKDGNYEIKYLMVDGQKIVPTDANPDPVIELSESGEDVIELHYEEIESEMINDVEFFDYNVTAPGTDTIPNKKNVNVTNQGMNKLSLTNGNKNRIVVGHPNVVNTGFTGIGAFSGQYVQPGIAKQFLNDGEIEFNVADPGLFTKEEIVIDGRIAKKYINDYKLGFTKSGNTYTLTSVYSRDGDSVLSNLDEIRMSYKNASGSRKLYSNLFWPLDNYPNYEGKDPLFGKDKNSNYEGYYGFSQNDEEGILGTYIKHNWCLGMHYEVEFTIGDYIGPMDYYFRGDDDFWLYIDGELVKDVDLGGVHSSTGAYVDLRQWMDERGMLDNTNNTHTMSVYFSERGGSGSCCYMSFTVPTNNEIRNGKTDYSVKKIWDDNNNENRPEEISVVLINEKSKEILDSAIITKDSEVSQGAWQYKFQDIPLYDINGDEISYRVIEEKTFDDYITEYNIISKTESEIINTHIKPVDIRVQKVWENDNGADRPESITVILKSDGKEIARADLMEEPVKENTKDIEYGSWSVTFKNLNSLNIKGNEIEYDIEELKNRNYVSAVENDRENNYTITNTLRESQDNEYKELIVRKEWQDNNDFYGNRPESIRIQLREKDTGFVLWEGDMAEHYEEVYLAESDKQLKDNLKIATSSNSTYIATPSDAASKPVSSDVSKAITIKENGFVFEDDGSFIIEDIEKEDHIEESARETSQKETQSMPENIPDDKELITLDESSPAEENTREDVADKTAIKREPTKEGSNDTSKSLQVEKIIGESARITEKDPVDSAEENRSSEEATDSNDGLTKEQQILTTSSSGSEFGFFDVDNTANGTKIDTKDNMAVENKETMDPVHNTENKQVVSDTAKEEIKIATDSSAEKIQKVLSDVIEKKEMDEETQKEVEEGTLEKNESETDDISLDEKWTLKFINVPMYDDNGREIEYEIIETEIPEGYSAEYFSTNNEDFRIVNTKTRNISGEKFWVDGGKSASRPESITVVLFSDDELVKTISVSENEEWKYEFNNLPVFNDNGSEIIYLIREFPVKGYETSYNGYDIYNTYEGYDVILPETGGNGTVMYYIIGITLVLALCFDLKKKKR